MQIVIEIPEVFYEYCKAQEDAIEIQLAVKNGIALPENHGRIVDLDTVTVEEDTDKGVLWLDAPTILEASYGKRG